MIVYTELTKKAMKIAYDAHKNQLDAAGIPYIYHPIHLAEQMDTEDEVCVALLHDVIEDSGGRYTLRVLKQYGFSNRIVEALSLLTHKDSMTYIEYIDAIKSSGNTLALKVKIADLRHNLDVSRFKGGFKFRKYDTYSWALSYLLKS